MNRDRRRALLQELQRLRRARVDYEGRSIPSSVPYLAEILARESESRSRDFILSQLWLESMIANDHALELTFARQRAREFPDIISWISLSQSLARAGSLDEAMTLEKEAADQALDQRLLVNYAIESYARLAAGYGRAGDAETALRMSIDSLPLPRSDDCPLELDWIEAARSAGAPAALIGAVLARATPPCE